MVQYIQTLVGNFSLLQKAVFLNGAVYPDVSRKPLSSVKLPGVLCDPHSLLSNGYPVSLPRVKRPGHETKQSYSSSAEVSNRWSYTATPLFCLYGVHRVYLNFKDGSISCSTFQCRLRSMYLSLRAEDLGALNTLERM